MPTASNEKLIITFENDNPLELLDFARSNICLANEFNSYVRLNHVALPSDMVKLCVKEVRQGSTIVELFAFLAGTIAANPQQSLQFAEVGKSVLGYFELLKNSYDFFAGDTDKAPITYTKTNLENYRDILEPVAKDRSSNIVINAQEGATVVYAPITINSSEANALQNSINRLIKQKPETMVATKEQVILRIWQSRNQTHGTAGDMGIIETVSPTPVKLIFLRLEDKQTVLDNPFGKFFIADIEVDTIEYEPRLYRVKKIHEICDIQALQVVA